MSTFLRLLFVVALLLNANSMSAQSAYCNSYEDFLKDNWIPLDTVNKEGPDNSQLWWWGGNSYKFSTGDKATDKILKKEAFMVKQNDTLYVNCRDFVFSDVRFGNAYGSLMFYPSLRKRVFYNPVNIKRASQLTRYFFFYVLSSK